MLNRLLEVSLQVEGFKRTACNGFETGVCGGLWLNQIWSLAITLRVRQDVKFGGSRPSGGEVTSIALPVEKGGWVLAVHTRQIALETTAREAWEQSSK